MKNFKILGALTAMVFATACNFNASYNKDFATGITTSGNGISAERVYLTDGENGLKTRNFRYGQKIYTNFENLEGFEIENGQYYPDMNVYVMSKKGDTILNFPDLYEGSPIDASINTLNGQVILADPIRSGEEYTINYQILDSKGSGSFSSKMDFKVKADESIKVTKSGLDFNEVYIINGETLEVITNNTMGPNKNVYFNFQGLSGYEVIGDEADLGLKVKVTDANGNIIVNEADVFDGQRVRVTDLKNGFASTLVMSTGRINNPLKWQVEVWDKNSDAKLNAVTEISVKE